jgi:hypothetical protein
VSKLSSGWTLFGSLGKRDTVEDSGCFKTVCLRFVEA